MVSKYEDYGYLFNELRKIVFSDKLDYQLDDAEYLIKSIFAINYFYAYQYMLIKRNAPIDEKKLTRQVFSDFKTFNSFINNMVTEYEMYDTVGSDKMLYFPNHEIAEYLFAARKNVVNNYFNQVFNNEKERVKA